MTSPLEQANSIASTDPKEAEKLYQQILQEKAGELQGLDRCLCFV